MIWTIALMLSTVALAGLVFVYVAYPHRGQRVPHVPWVGEALERGVRALPTVDNRLEKTADEEPFAVSRGR